MAFLLSGEALLEAPVQKVHLLDQGYKENQDLLSEEQDLKVTFSILKSSYKVLWAANKKEKEMNYSECALSSADI